MKRTSLKKLNEEDIKYAALSGVVGGVLLLFFEMMVSLSDKGFWAPIRAISSVFGMSIKDPGTQYDFFVAPVMVGIVIHIIFSMLLGVLFFILFYEVLKEYGFITGSAVSAAWGFVVYIVVFIVVLRLPVLSAGRIMVDVVPQWSWMVGYIIFGVAGFSSLRSMKSFITL